MRSPSEPFWIAATIVLLTALLGVLAQREGESSATLAAWVQAAGSIAAVIAAAWIAGRQSRESLARERAQAVAQQAQREIERAAPYDVLDAILQQSLLSLKIASESIQEYGNVSYLVVADFEHSQELLSEFDPTRLSNNSLIEDVITARVLLSSAYHKIMERVDRPTPSKASALEASEASDLAQQLSRTSNLISQLRKGIAAEKPASTEG